MKKTMRFSFLTLLVSLGIAGGTSVFGQQQETSAETKFTPKFGIRGGVNFANLYTKDAKVANMKVGLNAGFFAKLPVAKGISIQPELLYSNKGAKNTYDNAAQGSGEYRFNLHYIETPLIMVFNLTKNINLNGGAYLAYLVAANVKDMKSDGTVTGVQDLKAADFNRVDYGLIGGIGFDVENVTFGARYSYGLKNIGQSGNLSGDLTKNSRNSVATLYMGFAF